MQRETFHRCPIPIQSIDELPQEGGGKSATLSQGVKIIPDENMTLGQISHPQQKRSRARQKPYHQRRGPFPMSSWVYFEPPGIESWLGSDFNDFNVIQPS